MVKLVLRWRERRHRPLGAQQRHRETGGDSIWQPAAVEERGGPSASPARPPGRAVVVDDQRAGHHGPSRVHGPARGPPPHRSDRPTVHASVQRDGSCPHRRAPQSRLLDRPGEHHAWLGDRLLDCDGCRRGLRHPHRQQPLPAGLHGLHDRVPAADSVRGADPVGGTALRHRHEGHVDSRDLRGVLAGPGSGPLRRPGRRSRSLSKRPRSTVSAPRRTYAW